MAGLIAPLPRALAPVASVWCRQVDNEAESPGYTSIPDDFPELRETLETIRIVGNLTINVADTHDYWDPDPTSTLSFYPNVFLYPAAGGRYTCVGRMFLSTEDRPRLGMKTLVFTTAELLATGDFGGLVRRAHATMGGKSDPPAPSAEPEPNLLQAVGEGFLFHRGESQPVVVVASEQWPGAARLTLDLIGALPAALIARAAFLVFPYFLPATKVNLHEFAEQLPLALAVMRVPKGEASGERHEKRLESWADEKVTLRDLTKPTSGRSKEKEALPLVLQYVRDHTDEKVVEVTGRVDAVEIPRLSAHLGEAEGSAGKDRRKEMWRIGAAMETAALLLSKPKGRSVPMTGEAGRRAGAYLQAEPVSAPAPATVVDSPPVAPAPAVAEATAEPSTLPAWLQPPPSVAVPPSGPGVPVSTSVDPSLQPGGAEAPVPITPPVSRSSSPMSEAAVGGGIAAAVGAASVDPRVIDEHVATALTAAERNWNAALDIRLREAGESQQKATAEAQTALVTRVQALESRPNIDPEALRRAVEGTQRAGMAAVEDRVRALEARPVVDPDAVRASSEASLNGLRAAHDELTDRVAAVEHRPPTPVDDRVKALVDAKVGELGPSISESVRGSAEAWAERFRSEFTTMSSDLAGRFAKAEEDLRSALVAQMDLEVLETREQSSALKQEIEGKIDELLQNRSAAREQLRAKELRDVEQRLGLLVDGRTKDVEARVNAALATFKEKLGPITEAHLVEAERRAAIEREARIGQVVDSQSEALAGLQVRMQSFVEQKLRENQEKDQSRYLELLARLKADVEQSLQRTLESEPFEVAVRDRVTKLVEGAHAEQARAVAAQVKVTEDRLQHAHDFAVGRLEKIDARIQQRETELGHLERTVRHELDEFERRLKVVNDHVLPMVRQTWLKVSQEGTDTTLKEFRREILEEVHQVEAQLLQRTTELRDRLETSVAQNGRLWLNLLRQFTDSGGPPAAPSGTAPSMPAPPARRASGAPVPSRPIYRRAVHRPPPPPPPELAEAGYVPPEETPFQEDPPNPMDPAPETDLESRGPRRRNRRY